MSESNKFSCPNSPRRARSSTKGGSEASSPGISQSLIRLLRDRLSSSKETEESTDCSSDGNGSVARSRRTSSQSTLIGTPPVGYQSRTSLFLSDADYDSVEDSSCPRNEEQRHAHVRALSLVEFGDERENDSGIDWKIANHGLRLLNLSIQESHANDEESRRAIPSLTCQLYIHGITYGIRGLPSDLTNDEILSISASLPPSVRDAVALTVSPTPSTNVFLQNPRSRPATPLKPTTPQPPSILHRMIAAVILQLCLLIQFLVPYLRGLAIYLAAIEREQRIGDRLFKSSLRATEALVRLGHRICEMDEGRVGVALEDVMVWWIRGIAGGLRQGLGDGLLVLGDEIGGTSARQISTS